MRRLLTTVIALGCLGVSGAAYAQTVDLSWDACSPVVQDKTAPTAGPQTFFASVVGQQIPHKAYQVWFLVGDANQTLPEAWSFNSPSGCNAGFITYTSQPPTALAKACPPFVPISTQQFTIPTFQLSPPPLGYATTAGNGFLAVTYPSGSTNANPVQRYHLCQFLHDFTFAVSGPGDPGNTCGGFETPMCINLIRQKTSWLDTNGVESLFLVGNASLFFRSIAGCPDVGAKPATWGEIKGQYRY